MFERPIIYLDIESDNSYGWGLNCFKSKIVTIQFMDESGKVTILKDPTELSDELRNQLEQSLIVGHNLKFDCSWLKWHLDLNLDYVYDTQIAEIVISGGKLAGQRGSSLKDVVERRLGVQMDKSAQTGFQWGVPLTKVQEQYVYNDLKHLPKIYKQQQEDIKRLGLEEVIDIEMGCLPSIVWLYLSGISYDENRLAELRMQVAERRDTAHDKLRKAFASSKINFSSPSQIQKALASIGVYVEDASVDSIKAARVQAAKGTLKTKKAAKQTTLFGADDEMSVVEILDAISELKETEKLLNTFIDRLPTFVNSVTGRIHASYNQLGAKSGRMSCNSPNLQQQPSKRLAEWRTIFTAPKGKVLIISDYSQAELRILTMLSEDKTFIEAYHNEIDMHTLTASKVFHKEMNEVPKRERSIAKTLNFGIIYGLGASSLQRRLKTDSGLEISEEEAKDTISGYHKAYPGISKYLKDISMQGMKDLQVRTKAGRLMLFDPPKDESEQSMIGRLSANLPIQGLCADFVKVALGEIYKKLAHKGVKLIAVVHDEICLESPEEIADEVKSILEEEMVKAASKYITCIPVTVDIKISNYWQH